MGAIKTLARTAIGLSAGALAVAAAKEGAENENAGLLLLAAVSGAVAYTALKPEVEEVARGTTQSPSTKQA